MTPSNFIPQDHSMSTHPIDSHDEPTISVSDTFIEYTNRRTADDGSDYGDFGNDEEELEIVEQLLQQATSNASKVDENGPLIVIDIEDYEAPRGIRLPKVLGWNRRVFGRLHFHKATHRFYATSRAQIVSLAPVWPFPELTLTRS